MFDGKTFLPTTGIPMRKMACMSNELALAEPVPFTVPILKQKSFTADMDVGCRMSDVGQDHTTPATGSLCPLPAAPCPA